MALTKQLIFRGQDPTTSEVFCQPLFGLGLEKTASAENRSKLHPRVQDFVRSVKPTPGGIYVLVNALGAGEYWGCFPAGTLITTENGEVPIEQVKVGTRVLTHKNRFQRVQGTATKKTSELTDLYVQGLPKLSPALTATPNHEVWSVLRDDFVRAKRKTIWKGDTSTPVADRRQQALKDLEFSWIPITDLRRGDMIAEPFPLEEDAAALGDESWNRPEVAFLMGLYAAEGCVAYRYEEQGHARDIGGISRIVYVTGAHEDQTHLRARECAHQLGHQLTHSLGESNAVRLELSFKAFAQLCLDHIGSPAEYKFLSAALLRMPRAWQETFFGAYLGGDGHIPATGKSIGSWRCSSASSGLLHGMRLLLARLGYAASINGRHNTKATWYAGKPIFELLVGYAQVSGEESTAKIYVHPDGYLLSSVDRVETYDHEVDVFDLSVDEDASYVASGIVVHNSNVNGDLFPESALIHSPGDWNLLTPEQQRQVAKGWAFGYPTFMNAHPYTHHQNKDPTRAFGEVVLVTWNPKMHRVELVVYLDRELAARFGALSVIEKIEQGGFPDVSMGCKVPFDYCTICGHASKTQKDYCAHATLEMNKIYPDGRKVAVRNERPRFFDISFVFIGADKTAKVMAKLASVGNMVCLGDYCAVPRLSVDVGARFSPSEEAASQGGLAKTASVTSGCSDHCVCGCEMEKFASTIRGEKVAGLRKLSEIIKEIPAGPFSQRTLPQVEKSEQDLPSSVLDRMSSHGLGRSLSTAGILGIVLKPREFQKIVLSSMGENSLASDLEKEKMVFTPSDEIDRSIPVEPGLVDEELKTLLMPLVGDRSIATPALLERVARVLRSPTPSQPHRSDRYIDDKFFQKLAAAYNGYRENLIKKASMIQSNLASDSQLSSCIHGGSMAMAFACGASKTASASTLGPESLAYLTGAFYENRDQHTRSEGVVGSLARSGIIAEDSA